MMSSPSEPSRLDRLEALAETILLSIQQQSQQQQGLVEQQGLFQRQQALFEQQNWDREEFRASLRDLVQAVGTLSDHVLEMQSDVRGLQTDNRRILDLLERHLEDGHTHGTQP